MNHIFFISLFLTFSFVFSQNLSIQSESTKLHLKDVKVENPQNRTLEFTNRKGFVDLKSFINSDSISITKEGYEDLILSYQDLKNQNFQVFLTPSLFNLNEITISASKWRQLNAKVPNKILGINKEEADFFDPQTTADLLNSNGGVFVQKSQLGGGSPMIRGFSANRVLISVDGIRMNNAIFRSGNLQNVIALDPNSIERTEVLFGPGSLIYGSDAIGGVMSFYTLKPKLSKQKRTNSTGNALLRYSTVNQEKTGHFDFNLYGSKFSSLSSISYSDYENLKTGKNGPDEFLRNEFIVSQNGQDIVRTNPNPREQVETEYSQFNLLQKFRYDASYKWKFNYDILYSRTSNIPRYDRLIQKRSNGTFRSAEWFYGPQTWVLNHFQIDHESNSQLFDQFRVNLAHQFFEESRINRNLNSKNLRSRTENVNVTSANLDFVKKINSKQTLFYGAEALLNKVNSEAKITNIITQEAEPTSTRYPDDSRWNSYAAYASYEYNPSKKWNIQGGIRFNYVSSKSEFDNAFFDFPFEEARIETGAFNGNLGFVYKPKFQSEFRAIFSTGFRAPNIDDIGKVFDSEPGNVIVPNNQLVYEYAYNGEIGWSQILGKKIRFDATAYYTHLTDALIRRPFQFNGQDSIIFDGELSQINAIQNAANARVYGLQLGFEAHFTKKILFRSNFNYQDGEEELDNGNTEPLRHVSPTFGDIGLRYENGKFKANFYLNYSGEIAFEDLAPSEIAKPHLYAVDGNGNPFSPSWHTLNLKTSYKISDFLRINLSWENITNQRYRTYSSGIAAAGSNFIFSIRTQF